MISCIVGQVGLVVFNRKLNVLQAVIIQFSPKSRKVLELWDPRALSKIKLSSVSRESAPTLYRFVGGKKYLIWFLSAKTLPAKKKKKSHFLADWSLWKRSQESCFWFMLNCTLNTEQYSCSFFIPLLHRTDSTFTCPTLEARPPTQVGFYVFAPLFSKQQGHALGIKRNIYFT